MVHLNRKKNWRKYMICLAMICCPVIISATTYYVDSRKGMDSNRGSLISEPWKSIAKVNSRNFKPGDSICFSRNSDWTGELIINSQGIESRPILFTAYGKGSNPVIKNPGVDRATAIKINSDWIIVENFLVSDSHEAGIDICKGSEHNIIRNNIVTRTGIGIAVHGDHNLVTHNYAHDLTMVVNDPGGDNDFGAVGIWLYASNNEVSFNRLINCKAPSYDYGNDGGVVEFYGNVDSCYVHNNWGENCDGAFEVGGQGETLTHNIISYNVYVNNGFAGGFHVGGKFGVYFEDMRVENNVFIDTSRNDYAIGFWNGSPRETDFNYRNNIFYLPNYVTISNKTGFIHENNLYFFGGKTNIGITPGAAEKIGDPLFQDAKNNDFHLKAGSPAIDSGCNLKYTFDFDGNLVPQGSAPDIGAYEYGNTPGMDKRKK